MDFSTAGLTTGEGEKDIRFDVTGVAVVEEVTTARDEVEIAGGRLETGKL